MDNDKVGANDIHGEDLDESTEQKGPKEGSSSEKKCYIIHVM